jgi:hypothetical protein
MRGGRSPRVPVSPRTDSIFKALRIVWQLLGKARIPVIAGTALLLLLAALGVVHLASRRPVTDHAKTSVALHEQREPAAAPTLAPPKRPEVDDQPMAAPDRLLTIAEVRPKRNRFPDGSTQVSLVIGVTPLRKTKADDVEIRVFFYDVTRTGQLRPANAQVAYAWLTPVRDWSDPTPKFLEAIYLRPRHARTFGERTRYGGFIVQVYYDGRLQDERAEPRQIFAALKRYANSPAPSPTEDTLAVAEEEDDEPAGVEQTPTQTATPSSAPYGKPAKNKPGFVYSPHDERFIIDVRGVPPGTEIIDPNTGKPFRVP